MNRSLNSLIGYTIGASDGEIGKVKEFYFDDKTWTIRYLIVETGNWLSGRKVLIAAEMLLKPEWDKEIFRVNLSMEQVRNSPDIDTEQSVSRQEEIKWQRYYLHTSYWGNGFYEGGMPYYMHEVINDVPGKGLPQKSEHISHLRSTGKVTGYNIMATDGIIGEVKDFIVNDANWRIKFLVVDTGHWLPGKKVIISPKLIDEIDWATSEVSVKTSINHVRNSPEYNPAQPVSEDHEVHLHNYYSEFVTHIE
jgi:sporulation protein YlmC with PRC-barrel domain